MKKKLELFKKYLIDKGLSEITICNYINILKRIPKLEKENVVENMNKFLESNYQDLYYSACRQYLLFLGFLKHDIEREIYKKGKSKLEKIEFERRSKRKTVSFMEMKEIINEAYRSDKEIGLMIEIMYSYGLRIGAYSGGILHIKVKDISFDDGNKKIIVISKGKEHIIHDELNRTDKIRAYIKRNKLGENDRLFPYEYHYYRKRINKITKKVVGRELGTHFLRVNFATHGGMLGVPLETRKTIMGHSKIATTEGYDRKNEEMRKKDFKEYAKYVNGGGSQ